MARPVVRTLLTLALAGTLLAVGGCSAKPEPTGESPRDLVVVICPTLGWSDVTSGDMPAVRGLAEGGAAGLLVSRAPGDARTRLESGADAGAPVSVETITEAGSREDVDTLVADAMERSAGRATIFAALPAAGRPGFIIVSGDGYGPGLLTSASTKRAGIVTDADVAATMRTLAGATVLDEADGAPVAVTLTDLPSQERVSRLVALETFLVAMDRIRYPLLSAYTALMVVLTVAGWRVAETGREKPSFGYRSLVLRRALLFCLAVPVGGTLLFVIERMPDSPARIVTQLLGATALVWLFAQFAWHKWGTAAAVAFTGLVTAGVLALDQLLGAPLSVSALVSYSPIMALRFYGLGNEGAAMLVGAALVGAALELDAARASRTGVLRAAVLVGVGVVAVAAAPFFGANVVVALWGTVTFAVFFVRAAGRRFGWREAAGTLLTATLAVGAAIVLDRLAGSGTHIARAVNDPSPVGVAALALERLETSLRIFTSSPLPLVVLAVIVGFGYLCIRSRGVLGETLERHPLLRAALAAGFAGGAVGMLVEDSGLVILALMMLYLGGALVMVMLEPAGERPLERTVAE